MQGDVNADGKFDIADIVTLQKWLLAVPGVQLADWKAADLYADGKVDVFDLCMMRQKLFPAENTANQIHVKNTEELKTALENAKAGDEIILAEGEYVYSGETPKGYMFTGSADGTKENPIVIRSENPEKPAILSGSSTAENYVLSVSGDWWEIRDLKVTNAQKGIMRLSQQTLMHEVRETPSPLDGQHIAVNPPRFMWPDKYPHLQLLD